MSRRQRWSLAFLVVVTAVAATDPSPAAAQALPLGDKEPVLRVEAGGPTSHVPALAFSPDGKTLYGGGLDKVVRVWRLDEQVGKFSLQSAYRLPIGPGTSGAINTIAVSPDGLWLAVAGKGVIRETAGFREPGVVVPRIGAMSAEMREDEGTIYLIETKTGKVQPLRKHRGPVLTMTFTPARKDGGAVLVSIAREWDDASSKDVGVVRLWSPSTAEHLARLPENLPDPGNLRPGLAPFWLTEEGKEKLRVGIAWMDGNFRLWDPDRKELGVAKDGAINFTAAYSTGLRQVITGSSGKLQAWDVSAGANPQADPRQQVKFAPRDNVNYAPWALTLFSAQADGQLDHAATALFRSPGEALRLRIINLKKNLGTTDHLAELNLWSGGIAPVIAAAPRGKHLAVSGNNDHEILVYAIDDLLNEKRAPVQRLRGVGTTLRYVSFAGNGQERGLVLNEAPKKGPGLLPREPVAGDMIFNVTRGGLTGDVRGWQASFPKMEGWEVRPVGEKDDQGKVRWLALTVRKDGKEQGRVRLKTSTLVDDFALLPPGPFAVPLLAVAFHEVGEPTLAIYNVESGEQVRQLIGHEGFVRCLAFAGDGKLLASAAEDQMACVWSLTDLDKTLGSRGLVQGVGLADKDKTVVVRLLDNDALHAENRRKLAEDDVLEAVIEADGKKLPLISVRSFYNAVAPVKPGKTLTLLVRGPDGKRREVALVVSQGIDDRKPLFSLFVTRGDRPQDREWIGWNPIGPYDFSSARAERYLGWHIHTGKAENPTQFAQADQYRKEYYQKDLLKDLVSRGDYQKPRQRPVPEPEMGVSIQGDNVAAEPDAQGQILARQPRVSLRVQIDKPALEEIASVKWKAGDQAEKEFLLRQAVGQELSTELQLPRGNPQTIQVVLRTLETEPKVSTREVVVRYQPPAPRVENGLEKQRWEVRQKQFTVKAKVRPEPANQPVKVVLRNNGKAIPATAKKSGDALQVEETVELQPGVNRIELAAENEGAAEAYKHLESTGVSWEVIYTPDDVPPPAIAALAVTQSISNALAISIEPGRPVIVHTNHLRIQGKIMAAPKEILTDASVTVAGQSRALKAFVANKQTELTFSEELALKPGVQEFRLRASSTNSKPADALVVIEYQPLLPQLELKSPTPDLVLYEGESDPKVNLSALLVPSSDPQPYRAEILVNDAPAQVVAIEPAQKTLTHTVNLRPGDKGNRIEVRLTNAWKQSVNVVTHVRYLRPPRHAQLVNPLPNAQLAVLQTDLVFEVQSPTDLPIKPEFVELSMNGRPVPKDGFRVEKVRDDDKAKTTLWKVVAEKVALVPGRDDISLCVRNEEAECRKPAVWAIVVKPPKPAVRAVVEFLDPQRDLSVTEQQLVVRFRVRSESPLQKVELIAGSQRFGQGALKAEGANEFSHKVALARGPNPLRVEAVNDGGLQSAEVTVSYIRKPVRLVLNEPRPVVREGVLALPDVAEGKLSLRGEVAWPEDQPVPQGQGSVRIYVNDFLQAPVALHSSRGGDSRKLEFEATVTLNRKQGNQIAVELPGLPRDFNERRQEYTVNCANPQPIKVNLVLIGMGDEDSKSFSELADRACKLLMKEPLAQYVQEKPEMVFLGKDARRDSVARRLLAIKGTIERRAAAGAANEVWAIYYCGKEVINADGHYFLTSTSQFNPNLNLSALRCDYLAQRLNDFLGARLLLLDVDRRPQADASIASDAVANWAEDSRVAVLRSAWLDPKSPAPLASRLVGGPSDGPASATRLGSLVEVLEENLKNYTTKAALDTIIPAQLRNLPLVGR